MSAEPVVTGVISILAALSLKECICSIWYFLLNTKMTDSPSSLENHLHLHLLIWEFKGKSSSLERPPSVHTLFITYKEDRHGQQLGITAKLVCFLFFFSFFLVFRPFPSDQVAVKRKKWRKAVSETCSTCLCVRVLRCPWCCQPSRQATRELRPASRQPAPCRGSSPTWTPPSCSPPPARSTPRTTNLSPTTGNGPGTVASCVRGEHVSLRSYKMWTEVSDKPPLVIFSWETERTDTLAVGRRWSRKPLEWESAIHPEGSLDGGSVTSLPVHFD